MMQERKGGLVAKTMTNCHFVFVSYFQDALAVVCLEIQRDAFAYLQLPVSSIFEVDQ